MRSLPEKRELLIPVEKIDGEESNPKSKRYISLEVYYRKGGMSFSSYREVPRGYYISAGPIEVEETETCMVTKFGMGTARAQLIEDTKRLNRKRVDELFDEAVADYRAKQGAAAALVNYALERYGLKVIEE